MKFSKPNPITLAIAEQAGSPPRKITKIIPYKTGGFAVLAPYNNAKQGFLAKIPLDYEKRQFQIHRSETIEYSVDDRIKLSFHKDGFVQFSGEHPGKIISGRDPVNGQPKGLGILLEHPLYKPIRSGPTFVVSAWGLSEFEEITNTANPDIIIFPKQYWTGVRKLAGRFTLSLAFETCEASGAVFNFAIIPLGEQPIFLGVMVSRFQHSFPSKSGFNFSSPSDRKQGQLTGNSLMAIYPNFLDDPPTQNINYQVDKEPRENA
uniref:Uncharacterized protein n=1 Tax=Candidatus Kentrum sp. LPFa TaxID=2126335 RepID=A0A450VM16_9GAMM|nr:MAG: hypothetical protein BECKLPF1236B_GA0070989_100129 [Candidatus Kentron sp. LPFa]